MRPAQAAADGAQEMERAEGADSTRTEGAGEAENRIASGSEQYWRCVDFLLDEAAALDENRLQDWLGMLHPEIDYRIPIRATRERAAGRGFSEEGCHLFENYEALKTRVDRFATDYAWSDDPPARTRRFLSNFRLFELGGSDDLRMHASLLVYRERFAERGSQLLAGERIDDLRELDGELKLVRRLALLDHAVLPTPNLGFFL